MAVFPSFKLTEKGEELLNRSIGEGKTLTFTKFELGDGNTPSDFRKQTGLVNKFYEFPILNTSIQKDQTLRIKGYFDNKSFSQDKQLKEIGVFVKIEGNETQYLYSYTNAGDTGDIIPSNSRGFYSRTLDVANYIGYATNITFNIEQLRDRYAFNTENEMKVASYLKAGDKVELWGNLVLGDKPTDEYIIQESGEIQLSNGLFAKKVSFNYIAQTIEELQRLALKVGDVIEVLGYYTAGDGANHKRIIANEDDGSGVQLANGLWANIVKSDIYYSNCFGANKSGDVTDIFKKMIAYNKPLIINKGEYNLSEFIFDIEGIIKEDNGIYSNKSIIRTEKLPENKPLKKLIGMFDYNGIMTQRGHQSLAYNKNKQEYILGFMNTDSEQSTLIFLDKNFSFIKKANVDLGHCNGLTYNPKTNKLIAGGYLDSTVKANQIFVLNYDTLAIEKTVNIGYALLGVGYDEEKDFYCAGGRDTFTILDNNFNIIKKIIGTPNNEFQGLTTQDVELFNGNYFNYLYDLTENIHMISYDLKGNVNQHYVFYDKGRYEPEGIFKLNNHTLLTTEYKGTQILFFEFDFNEISLNIKDINIPLKKVVYIDSNALYNGDGTQNKPYKSIKYALLDNLGVPHLEISCKGVFDEGVYEFYGYKNITIGKWGNEKPTIIGQLAFYGNTVILIAIIISSGNKNIDRLIYGQGSNFYIDDIEINQNANSKKRGVGFYRCTGYIKSSKFNNCANVVTCNEASNVYLYSCSGTNNDIRYVVLAGILYHFNSNFNTTKDTIDSGLGEIYPKQAQISELNTPYHMEKMKQENVYDDYISYMDEKTAYDKKQRKLEEQRQLAYEQALEENPNLTYEEVMSVQPMTLNLAEEPRPSEALKRFMEKYL